MYGRRREAGKGGEEERGREGRTGMVGGRAGWVGGWQGWNGGRDGTGAGWKDGKGYGTREAFHFSAPFISSPSSSVLSIPYSVPGVVGHGAGV